MRQINLTDSKAMFTKGEFIKEKKMNLLLYMILQDLLQIRLLILTCVREFLQSVKNGLRTEMM